ncbi:G4 quadruplex nucleic acid binding protein [Beauveria asiatica]|uniref:G4 quadruplex nucleic acid binding protein n=1 Tax=Beauveria asiatica TaxID=1069075 RepID=A0AAW0RFT3_9HYPO
MPELTLREPAADRCVTELARRDGKKAKAWTSRSPSFLNLRVGHVLGITKHPNADRLYVSAVAAGDSPGHRGTFQYKGQTCRTVCSGPNGLVPLQELRDCKVIVVRNVKHTGDDEGANRKCIVEMVDPPAESTAGDRVFFQNWEGSPKEKISTQRKVWKATRPGFRTTDDLGIEFLPSEAGLVG